MSQAIQKIQKNLELYSPHRVQQEFHEATERYRVASWGRQSGKSTACLNDLLKRAWENPGTCYWFLSPTSAQALIQYRRLVGMLSPCWNILLKKNQTERRVKLVNYSQIVFQSGEVLHNLRGETLNGAVIDEVRQQHPDLWIQVVKPMLSTTRGWCAFVSTPSGMDNFYDLYQRGLMQEKNWRSFQAPSTCNPLFTQEEYEENQGLMSEDVFAQEIGAEFREIGVGKAYKSHGQHNMCFENPFAVRGYDWSPYLPIIVGLDFNVGLMVWEMCQKKGNEFYFGDEIAVENTDTEQCATVLTQRIKDFYDLLGPGRLIPPVILVGDASGNARKTSAVGQTDYKIIKRVLSENGIPFEDRTPTENPFVKDRINCMNGALKASDGTINLRYHPVRCKYLKRDFERVKWKTGADGAIIDKSDPLATHASDAAGYPVTLMSEIFKSKPGIMRVINR